MKSRVAWRIQTQTKAAACYPTSQPVPNGMVELEVGNISHGHVPTTAKGPAALALGGDVPRVSGRTKRRGAACGIEGCPEDGNKL